MTSRHVSVWIDAAPEVVYAIAADPQQLPRWASGLAESALRQTAEGWVADSPMGEVIVEFAPANEYGVLDHVVRMPSGEAVYNPFRVIPAGEGQAACPLVGVIIAIGEARPYNSALIVLDAESAGPYAE